MKAEIANKTEEGEGTQQCGGKEKKRPQREEDQVIICCDIFIVKPSPPDFCPAVSVEADLTKPQRYRYASSRESSSCVQKPTIMTTSCRDWRVV